MAEKLKIIPLGGLNEIGKNMTVLEYGKDIIIVDCGLGFPDEEMYGVDLVIADMTYLVKNKDKIRGMFLTHGHEDHIGGIPYAMEQFNCPIHATRLTAGIVQLKLEENQLQNTVHLFTHEAGEKVKAGCFTVEFIHVNHSIADAVAFAIKTPVGTIVMTGDFKIDATAEDGMIDLARFGALGKEGVLALLCDSTNVERQGYTPSEKTVAANFERQFSGCNKRIIVTTFASNAFRLQSLIATAKKFGRKVAGTDRSMDNILNVLRRITVNGMLAVACTMTLLVGGFDLSIGHVMALSAVLCIGFEKSTGSGAVGIVVALAAGLVLGLINGLLMKLTRGGSGEGFMITLATGMMAQALAKWYCAGSEIIRIDLPAEIDWFKQLGQGNLLGFPICTLIWIAVMVILQIVIKKTTFGRQMLLTGANKKSAFLAGINVNRVKVIAYTVAGFCCGIAAVIYAARFTSASDGAGVGGDFNGAVCSIIGGNALYGGHGGMVQVFIGTVTFGLISNILQLFGLSTAVQYIVQGAILLLAINLDNLKKR